MAIDWLAPVFPQSQAPFSATTRQKTIVSLSLASYILFVIYPAYIGVRYLWFGAEPAWQTFVYALLTAVAFGLFAFRTMSQLLRVRSQRRDAN